MDPSSYTELRELPELTGSLNAIVSSQHKLRRPPSLSESFAWTPENVERAAAASAAAAAANNAVLTNSVSNTSLEVFFQQQQQPAPSVGEPPPPQLPLQQQQRCELPINILLRFLFHLTLLSIFETVFFFLYVSQLEDAGITHTVDDFTNGLLTSCRNFSAAEQAFAAQILNAFLNVSQIVQAGSATRAARDVYNASLFKRAWIYVGVVSGVFVVLAVAAKGGKIKIHWKHLVFENLGLISLLAAYEYTFFSTVIFPYNPVSASEIAATTLLELQSECGV